MKQVIFTADDFGLALEVNEAVERAHTEGVLSAASLMMGAPAAADAVHRAAPEAETRPPGPGERPDLVVLACDDPIDPDHRDALHVHDQAHLVIRLAADHGVVGPLVVPGLTSCLRCADLHRIDRDDKIAARNAAARTAHHGW